MHLLDATTLYITHFLYDICFDDMSLCKINFNVNVLVNN